MQKRKLISLTVLLILAIGNYARSYAHENIRAVAFVSIFAIGVLAGALINEVIRTIRNKQQ